MSTPHVIGCRCEACREGLTEQHPAGCLCAGCKERESTLGASDLRRLWRMVGGRVEKAFKAADAVKDVLTPREREAVVRFLKGQR